MENISYYKQNAAIIRQSLSQLGFDVYGGKNAPYIWLRTPGGIDSWDFFDMMLNRCQVLCTPGVGFGRSGQGYVRLTSFGLHEDTREAMVRLQKEDLANARNRL